MERLNRICENVSKLIPETSKWEIDKRFSTTLVGLEVEIAESIKDDIASNFDQCFDHKTIKKSSHLEKELSIQLGGVDKNQLLFVASEGEMMLFCAWWPWGDKKTISIRIGLFDSKNELGKSTEIENHLKNIFQID